MKLIKADQDFSMVKDIPLHYTEIITQKRW